MKTIFGNSPSAPVTFTVVDKYDEPMPRDHFITAEAYEAYAELFFARPLSQRFISRTIHRN